MFMDGKRLERWGVLDLSGLSLDVKKDFVELLYENGNSRGLTIDYPIYEDAYEDDHEAAFKKIYENLEKKFGSLFLHNLPQFSSVFFYKRRSSSRITRTAVNN